MKHYLFTTYYQARSSERQAEYDYCIDKNKSAGFDKIFIHVENNKDFDLAYNKFGAEVINIDRRPTFRDFFDFLSAEKFNDSINVVANTDIFFLNMKQINENLPRLQKGKSCFALARYEYKTNTPSRLRDRPDSQDSWIFNGNEKLDLVQNINFTMGVAGCDNRLAFELQKAGFEVLNPSRSVYSFHLHNPPRIPRPYLLLPPTI